MWEVLEARDRWVAAGKSVVVATVVSVTGSAPWPVGSKMIVSSDGDVEGNVTVGCVESDVLARAEHVLETGRAVLVGYGYAEDEDLDVGLMCGGRVEVFISRW